MLNGLDASSALGDDGASQNRASAAEVKNPGLAPWSHLGSGELLSATSFRLQAPPPEVDRDFHHPRQLAGGMVARAGRESEVRVVVAPRDEIADQVHCKPSAVRPKSQCYSSESPGLFRTDFHHGTGGGPDFQLVTYALVAQSVMLAFLRHVLCFD